VQGISDLLYDVGRHRGLDLESVRARRAGGRSGGDVKMTRGRWLRGGGRESNTLQRKRELLRRREPGLVRPCDFEETSLYLAPSSTRQQLTLTAHTHTRTYKKRVTPAGDQPYPRNRKKKTKKKKNLILWTSDTITEHSSTSFVPATTQTRPTSSP
jgi:hypothetical protein